MNVVKRRERYQNGSLTIESRKRGSDVWVLRWQNGRFRPKKILGSVKELTKAGAQKQAREFLHLAFSEKVEHGDSVTVVAVQTPPAPTVADFAAQLREEELGPNSGRAEKPRKAYLSILENYILPKWGSYDVTSIKTKEVADWLKSLPLANGSKAKLREVFSKIFRHAMYNQIYKENPIALVRQKRKKDNQPEILEGSEILATLRQLEEVRPVHTAFLIGSLMGLRRSEIFGLKWRDVDFDRSILHIRRSYVDGVEGNGKNDGSKRPLPVPSQVLEALNTLKASSKYAADDDWVFASDFHFGKKPLWPGTLWRRNVIPALARAGITKPNLGWHTLRRSFASLLLSEGANLRTSMELMRHSTAEMTLGTYAQSVGRDNRSASERVASSIFTVPGSDPFVTQMEIGGVS
ncbi:MAG: site-specific integrase [Acidobacteriaceae bacterium]|nr:site-specific integrase [Acidobacteriaceae bacterium]